MKVLWMYSYDSILIVDLEKLLGRNSEEFSALANFKGSENC